MERRAAVRELAGFEPDLAVAKGASIYGRNRVTGKGLRIKAGASRSYYIGLETSMPAVPGFRPPLKALCVVPQGMEEGSEVLIEGRDFALVTGQPAEFRFFSSEVRSGDAPGQILPDAERELVEISLLEVDLPAVDDIPAGQPVPVQINALVTELGTLELWMNHTQSDRRWKVVLAVAKGASFFGRIRVTGEPRKVLKAGASRSYYIGLDVLGYFRGAWLHAAAKSIVRRAARHGGRRRGPDRGTRSRPRHRTAGGIQVLLLGSQKRRYARRDPPRRRA